MVFTPADSREERDDADEVASADSTAVSTSDSNAESDAELMPPADGAAEAAPRASASRAPAERKTPARKTPAGKTPARKTPERKSPARKPAARKTPARKPATPTTPAIADPGPPPPIPEDLLVTPPLPPLPPEPAAVAAARAEEVAAERAGDGDVTASAGADAPIDPVREGGPERDPESDLAPAPEPEATSKPAGEPDPAPGPDPEPETNPESDRAPETNLESDPEPEPEANLEPDPEPETDLEPEPESEHRPEPEPSLELAPDLAADDDPAVPALALRGVTKRFGGVVAVDAIDLVVPAGSFYGIVGPNGAGKTTTLSMIAGLLRPDNGEISVCGIDSASDPRQVKRMLGVLPDRLRTFDRLTGRQLLYSYGVLRGLKRDVVESRIADLARAFDLTDSLGRVVSDYSAGMTKKVMLAGAMIHSPRVLVLDEPFEAVDPVSSQVILDILGGYVANGGTVVLSSHGMSLVEAVCSRVAVIVDGQVLAEGTVDEVRGELSLEQRFMVLAGGLRGAEGLEWLHTFSE